MSDHQEGHVEPVSDCLRMGYAPQLASPWVDRAERLAIIEAWREHQVKYPGSKLPRVVLVGMAGIGKTQLAASIYSEISGNLDLSLWVSATHLGSVLEAYAQAEDRLQNGRGRASHVTHGNAQDTSEGAVTVLARRFLERLDDGTFPRGWLVVLDDLSIPDREMEAWWPPMTSRGRTLVTTRSLPESVREGQDTTIITVGGLTYSDSLALLRSSLTTDRSRKNDAALEGLAMQAQGHSLTLGHIVALLRKGHLEPAQILDELVTPARLAQTLYDSGRLVDANDQLESLLAAQSQVLSPDDPDVLATRANLAAVQAQSGRLYEAIQGMHDLLSDMLRVLGPDHPTTLTTRANLAQLLGQAGDVPYAIAELRSLLADQVRVLGPDHPTTLTTREELAYWLGKAGDPLAAMSVLEDVLSGEARQRSRRTPERGLHRGTQ